MKIFFTFLFLLISGCVLADYVSDGKKRYYGTVLSISRDSIILLDGGDGPARIFRWSDKIYVKFSVISKSDFPPNSEISSNEPDCKGRNMFQIKFIKMSEVVIAQALWYSNNTMHITLFSKQGNAKKMIDCNGISLCSIIEWIQYSKICQEKIPATIPEIKY